jgi:hypothetical protein
VTKENQDTAVPVWALPVINPKTQDVLRAGTAAGAKPPIAKSKSQRVPQKGRGKRA